MLPVDSPSLFLSSELILEKVSAIAVQIQQSRKLEHIFQDTIADARAILQTDRVLIYQFLENHQDAVVAFESVGAEWTPIIGHLIYDPCLTATWIDRYRQGEISSLADISEGNLSPCYVDLLESLQVKSNLVVPILSQGELWGLCIAHHCCSPREWQPLEVDYLKAISLHLGIAIQQAELHQSHQRLKAELVQRSVEEHPMLRAITDASLLAFYVVDNRTDQIIYFNHRFCQIWKIEHLEKQIRAGELNNGDLIPDCLPLIANVDAFIESCKPLQDETNQATIEDEIAFTDGRTIRRFSSHIRDTDDRYLGRLYIFEDITDRKQRQELVRNIAQGVSAATGEAFFRSLVDYIIRLLGMDQVFVGELISPDNRIRIIAGLSNGQALDGLDYSLVGTPCEQVLQHGFCIYPDHLQQRFPNDLALQIMGGEGYVGIPLVNSAGAVIGIIGVISNHRIPDIQFIQEVLTIFAVRAASELERQQFEAMLRRYERIVSATPDCVSLIDRNYIYQVINQTYLTWNQKSYDEIIGHSVSDLLGQEFFKGVAEPHLDACLSGEPGRIVEGWRDYADGQRRFVRATYTPYLDGDGTISGVVINVHDLTHLKLAEEALRESEERFRQMATSIHEVFWMTDIHCTETIYVSPGYEEIWQRSCTSLYEKPRSFLESVHPDDLPRISAILEQYQFTGLDHEYRLVHPDGTIRWIWERAVPIHDSTGMPYRVVGVSQDITDRKLMEIALRKQQQFTEQIAESTVAVLYVYDLVEQHNVYVNQQIETVLGYTPDEVQGMGNALFPQLVHPDDLPQVMVNHQRLLTIRDDEFVETEYRMRHKSGAYRWLLSRDRIFNRAGDGSPLQGLGVATDITVQKEIQATLGQQAERERLLAAIAQKIRQTLDLDQILQTTVTEVRQLLQVDRVIIYRFEADWSGIVIAESVVEGQMSILGMQVTDTYFVQTKGQTYHPRTIKVTNNIYTENLDPCHIELLEKIQVQAKLVVPILQDDRLWGLLIAQHCQSPRQWQPLEIELQQQLATQIAIAIQQSELYQQVQLLNTGLEMQVQERTAQLQQSLNFEALLKRITDHMRDSLDEEEILQKVVQELAIAMKADCCDVTSYNLERNTFTVKYEYNRDGCRSKNSICTVDESSDPHLYPQLLRGQYCHFCLIGKNVIRPGHPRKTILACPIVDEQGVFGDLWLFKPAHESFNELEVRLVQQVATQCTIALRQSRLYQAAQAQVKELERLSQLKDDFLSTVSHELRSPMSNIKMATQMLEIHLNRLGILADKSSAINRYLKILQEEGRREVNLINDLLDLARLDAGTEPLNLTPVNLQSYIPYLTEPFLERTQQQQQQLVITIPPDFPSLTTDSHLLERILTELLHNACKYTPAGGQITVSAQSDSEAVEIQVSNSGVEIPLKECDRIFDKFYRIPNNDPWKHGGTGLGLALVKKLTERLGSQIHVESGCGRTTFILQFKIAL